MRRCSAVWRRPPTPGSAPALAAASSFGQSWDPETLQSSQQIPVRNFRDEIYWQRVEQPDGRFRFDQFTTTYPAMLGAIGADMSLILGGVHAGHDGGVTPYTPEGVAAFGRMAAPLILSPGQDRPRHAVVPVAWRSGRWIPAADG